MWIVSFTTLYFDLRCHVWREIVFENWQLKFYVQDIDFMYLFFIPCLTHVIPTYIFVLPLETIYVGL
jgi:hypothetical protein